jgi:hypothetical protein
MIVSDIAETSKYYTNQIETKNQLMSSENLISNNVKDNTNEDMKVLSTKSTNIKIKSFNNKNDLKTKNKVNIIKGLNIQEISNKNNATYNLSFKIESKDITSNSKEIKSQSITSSKFI